ncbi:MAG: hypothetical protein M3N29_06530 [Chloroflexota bacterium]|nr:hypothetical protein [Chloroflexota bacterium]
MPGAAGRLRRKRAQPDRAADVDIAAGTTVVVELFGSTLVVKPAPAPAAAEGGTLNA